MAKIGYISGFEQCKIDIFYPNIKTEQLRSNPIKEVSKLKEMVKDEVSTIISLIEDLHQTNKANIIPEPSKGSDSAEIL